MSDGDNVTHIGLGLHEDVLDDLEKSGLEPKDINCRMLGPAELAATKTHAISGRPPIGYVIPYYDIQGDAVKFYRIRILEVSGPTAKHVKYKQPAESLNHIYYPPGFSELLKKKDTPKYVIITEGEKKAAKAVREGFLCVAVSGVDSWKNRSIILPKDTTLETGKDTGTIRAKIPAGLDNPISLMDSGPLAIGMADLIDTMVDRKMTAIIIFDSDKAGGVKMEVQRAAATLGYEFRYRGLALRDIRQIILPTNKTKMGLDDFLVLKGGKEELQRLVKVVMGRRTAFPRHPNPRAYIGTRLQKTRLLRKEAQDIALAVIAELEARGRRIRTVGTDELHYFDEATHTLYPVSLNSLRIPLHETSFGAYLYREFGLGAADKRIVDWLATQYTGEPTVDDTETQKVLAVVQEDHLTNCIAYQLSDSHYAIVTGDPQHPLIIRENGTHGILFEKDQVRTLNYKEMEVEFYKNLDRPDDMRWFDVFEGMNVKRVMADAEAADLLSEERLKTLLSLLYYISPWLLRWRNTQLPIELVIGEAGSGKSSLLGLRQRILTGTPYLANMSYDIRDWYAGITSRGGIYVLDNVHFAGDARNFRQRLSDELCRLVTEPRPHVEMRKLYTSSQVLDLPVRCTFAMTSIEQPFYNSDLLQRAAIFQVEAIQRQHDSDWTMRQLRNGGGREGWIGHHLAAVHRFLHLANGPEWNPNYIAKHRLANYEQCLMLMGQAFGLKTDWIPDALVMNLEEQLTEADWVHRALKDWVEYQRANVKAYEKERWSVQDITQWAAEHDTYTKNTAVTNPWKLGKYIKSHKSAVEQSLGLYENGKYANKTMYSILRRAN